MAPAQVVRDPGEEIAPGVVAHDVDHPGLGVRIGIGKAVSMQEGCAEAGERRLAPDRVVRRPDRSGACVDAIEHDDLGARLVGQTQRAVAVTTAEAEGRDVGIRRHHRGGGRAGERLQQLPLQWPGLLEVVDVDMTQLPLPCARSIDGELEQAAVVDDSFECHDIGVDLSEAPQGLPCGDARPCRDGIEIIRAETEFACAREHGAHVVCEAERRRCSEEVCWPWHLAISDRTAQQVTNARILFGSGEKARHGGL